MRTSFVHTHIPKRKYTKYQPEVVEEVFQKFGETGWTLMEISQESNVPYPTIQKWFYEYRKDSTYRPGQKIGQHRRYFTKEEEESIASYLRDNYIKPGKAVKRKHLRLILFNAWQQQDIDNRSGATLTKQMFSHQFIKKFCKRNNLSFRMIRGKKRSAIDQKEVEEFTNKRKQIFQKYPKNRIGNMDETSWHFVYARGRVLAERGTEEVDAQLPEDKRACFTVIATILADGTKCNPVFLAKGKTIRSHQQFQEMNSPPDTYELWHSTGKNTDDATMSFYLEKYSEWMSGEPCALFLDRYTSHESESTKAKAEELKIELVFIPKSATDLYQPLDKTVFGVLKSSAAAQYDEKIFEEDTAFNKSEAADLFLELWNDLKTTTVLSGWRKTGCEEDEEIGSYHSSDKTLSSGIDLYYSSEDISDSL